MIIGACECCNVVEIAANEKHEPGKHQGQVNYL